MIRRRLGILLFLAIVAAAAGTFILWRTSRRTALKRASLSQSKSTTMISYFCYFPSRSGFDLIEEVRQSPKPETNSGRLRAVLEELHRGPSTAEALPLFPSGMAPSAVFLAPDGTLYLDEPREAFDLTPGLREEFLFTRALARTLIKNCPEVSSFALLSNGGTRYRLFTHLPAHGQYTLPRQPVQQGR